MFSVLMSVYADESPRYLEECLQSLVEQTLVAEEVILVEDGPISTELSRVISEFESKLNIVSVRLEKNNGLAAALNAGLNHCSFDLVVRMDTDDVSVFDRFEKQVKFMNGNPEVAVLSGFVEEWDENMSEKLDVRNLPSSHAEILSFAKHRCPMSHPAVVYRKEAVLSVGGYPSIYPEDYPLWCLLLSKGYKMANLQEVLVKMRVGDGFMSRRGRSFYEGEVKVFKYLAKIGFINRFQMHFNVYSRLLLRLSPDFMKKVFYKLAR
jgi:glycosyltransferase involved in cell wall biosynthesis